MIRRLLPCIVLMASAIVADACTSMIVSAEASATGRPLLWKHRDTSTENNFVAAVPAKNGDAAYVALYNVGDSLLEEAWMGMNEYGFAIMNTASYNLAPDTTEYKDREGIVMTKALKSCRSVDDFERLLNALPKPLGVQANFGVIDRMGNGAYFEANDYNYVKYSLSDAPDGVLVRTNYSESGNDTDGYGYIRCENAKHLLQSEIQNHNVSPQNLTERLSRSFYHSLMDKDFAADADVRWVVDQDFIPRRTSTASIVVEGVAPDEDPRLAIMWTAIGYPPCSHVDVVTVDSVPEALLPNKPDGHCSAGDEAMSRMHKAFPIGRGNGQHYIDMQYLLPVMAEQHKQSVAAYERGYRERDQRKAKF